tara:strand:- start:123 stop:1745 length:1623 start_codon:yes stop_codon:yes gene_type:complete
MRGRIFEEAAEKLNLLQPEFVLSVGDLIDGYTEDPEVWNAQWDEFDAIVNKLDMPFYYVPGNHDTSNELLTEVWRERHGRDFYHFIYKNVLFLALNTDQIKNGGIGEDQIKYFQNVLKENKDVQWTLLFMHRPLWSYGDRAGYGEIEEALGDRNYTLFSGHHHNYRYKMQNGMEHYTLATTGGGSYMRNPDVGEFDHITWVTMKEKGPEVAHIELDGIHDKNVVPDKDYEDIQVLRQGNWLNVKPYVSKSETVSEFPISLIVENTSEREFFIRGKMPVKNGIRFEPEVIEERLAPSSSKEIIVKAIQSGEVISIAELNNNPIDFEMEAGFEREERDDISLKTSKILLTDWNHTLQKASNKITIDGNLDDWTESKMIKVNQPQYFNEDWDWKGKDDGRFEFGVNYDDKNVNIAVHFFDQKTIAKQDVLEERQDKFFVHLDTNFEDEEYKILEIGLGGMLNNSDLKNVKYQVSKTVNGQILELSIPLDQLAGDSKTQLQKIRVNVGIMDHDRPENTKPSVLWWRPVWGTNADYPGSGMFVRQ